MTTTTWGSTDMVDPGTAAQSWLSQFGPVAGVFGVIIAIITTSLLALRKYLSSESVNTSANAAQTDLINLLRQQIVIEHTRADAAEKARDEAIAQITDLKLKVEQLTVEVQALRKASATT